LLSVVAGNTDHGKQAILALEFAIGGVFSHQLGLLISYG
jgi:hypothetical protein